MKHRWIYNLVCACLLFSSSRLCLASAEDSAPHPPLDTLEKLVEQWVGLRAEIARERRKGKEQQDNWKSEIQLLEKEIASLRQEVNQSRASKNTALKDQAERLARKETLENRLQAFPAILDRAEAQLRRWKPLIPPPLAAPLEKGFQQLPAPDSRADSLPVSRRLQIIIALYTQIETLHKNIHLTKEILATPPHSKREMDVLYIGLAQALAVSPDNKQAAIGKPGSKQWIWTPAHSIAPDIRKAVAVFNREQTAELVTLPLSITDPWPSTSVQPEEKTP